MTLSKYSGVWRDCDIKITLYCQETDHSYSFAHLPWFRQGHATSHFKLVSMYFNVLVQFSSFSKRRLIGREPRVCLCEHTIFISFCMVRQLEAAVAAASVLSTLLEALQ